MSDEIVSPRIAELRRQIAAGDAGAVEAFWQHVATEGAPIVEAIEGDGDHRLVTFVYRATEPVTNVVVFPGLVRGYDAPENVMAQLPGSDVWYRTYRARSDLRLSYHFSPNDSLRAFSEMRDDEVLEYQAEITKSLISDPLNPHQFAVGSGQAPSSILRLPDAPPQRYLPKREGVPEGTIEREDIARDPLGEGRRIWTYLPSGYDPAAGPYPLLVQFDGWISRKLGLHRTLDNMIAEGVIPPTIAVMVHQIDRMKELSCNEEFADWLAAEFVPSWVRSRYAVSDDPAKIVASGMSLGGLSAAWCGLRHPEVFGNVLSQSGSYWWGPKGGPWAWLTKQYEASQKLPLRVYMDIGLLEDSPRPDGCPVMIDANRAMHDLLVSKGYDLSYSEFNGGHDYVSWRGSIADGLEFLLGPHDR